MTEIHCRMSDKELNQYGIQIGEMLYPDIVAKRYDHACSDMISMYMISILSDISVVCDHTYTEVMNSIQLMTRWINFSKIARCIRTAVEKWLNAQANIVFDNSFLGSNIEEYPRRIQEDICVFCGWAIYNGADGASIRKGIPSSTQKHLQRIIKCHGVNGIINMLWRSLTAFISMSEKAIEPKYLDALKKHYEQMKHGTKDNAEFGIMANALNHSTREVRHEV